MRTSLRRSLLVGAAALSATCLLVPNASASATQSLGDDVVAPGVSAPGDRRAEPEVRAAAVADPRHVIAVTGTDNRLWVKYTNQPSFFAYGGFLVDTPAVALGPNTNYFIGVGSDRNLWIRSDTRDWQRFGPVGTNCAGPSAVVSVDTLAVACRGGNDALYVAKVKLTGGQELPVATGFAPLGGVLRHGVSVSDMANYGSSTPVASFEYSGLGSNNRPYSRNDQFDWEQLYSGSGPICGASFSMSEFFETAACKSSGSNALLTMEIEPGAGITNAGGGIVGRPGVAVDLSGVARFYVLGPDRNIYVASQDRGGSPSSFSRFGGAGLYGVAAASFD